MGKFSPDRANGPLAFADSAVYEKRGSEHGTISDNFNRTARVFNALTDKHLTASDVTLLLQVLKMCREQQNPGHKDHLVDQCGYVECRWLLGRQNEEV